MIAIITVILQYLTVNKVIILGAATTVSELAIICYNFRRRIKAIKDADDGIHKNSFTKESLMKTFIWSANPLNLFKNAAYNSV